MTARHALLLAITLIAAEPAGAAQFRPGQIVVIRRSGKPEEVRVVRQDEHGVLVQYKDWQDGTFHDDLSVAPTAYYQPGEVREKETPRPAAPQQPAANQDDHPAAPGPGRPATAAAPGQHQPGDIVVIRRWGKPEEVRVVRQDEHGVLVQYKDWQDGTFHDDLSVAPTAYYQATEVKARQEAAPTAEGASQTPGRAAAPGGGLGGGLAPQPAAPIPAAAPAAAQPGAEAPAGIDAAALPAGEYLCYTYHPKPVVAGAFTIDGGSYRTRTGATGRYRMAGGGRIEWLGTPPLGFAVGVLEELEPKPKVRMYPTAGDIGNKWKAAVCLPREDTAAPAGAGQAQAGAAGGAYAAGSQVEMIFAGYWYAATVVRCSGARCLLDYDDPKWEDEWVETSRMRQR